MHLSQTLRGVESRHLSGPNADTVEVRFVTADSREVGPGGLFVAVPGTRTDGHEYALEAAGAGCAAVLLERPVKGLSAFPDCSVHEVSRGRAALALCVSNFYGRPGERLCLAGITGTNGKTTVAWLLAAIAEQSGKKVGLLGTIGVRRRGVMSSAAHTTPSPEVLQRLLSEMVEDGTDLAVMEVSSHALDQERVVGCRFSAAAFTGLSRDHLDYHSDLEQYYIAKTRLFTEHLRKAGTAVVLVDDEHGSRLHGELLAGGRVRTVAATIAPAMNGDDVVGADSAVVAREAGLSLSGSEAIIELPNGGRCQVESELVGDHNIANFTVAAGLAHSLGVDAEQIGRGLSACRAVPGRLERVPDVLGARNLFVDYAHTSDALSRVISGLRDMTPLSSRIIVVIGCGGDRDRGKRPLMASAAASADVVVVTSDNPRSEDPQAIISDMLPGLEGARYVVNADRRAAIEHAVAMARDGDVILVAGKGHESTQEALDRTRVFDDRDESRRALTSVPPETRPLPGHSVEGST